MATQNSNPNPKTTLQEGRAVGVLEHGWCRAVAGGTGITVLALTTSKPPDFPLLQSALQKLQISHPILRSKLHSPSPNTFSFITSPSPFLQIKSLDLSSTSSLLHRLAESQPRHPASPSHLILEHELNTNSWSNGWRGGADSDLLLATAYALPDEKWMVALRFHTTACDRTTAVSLLKGLRGLMSGGGGAMAETEIGRGICSGIEELIPSRKSNKSLWVRGMDMIGYSVNSFRLTNLKFKDAKGERCSAMVRLQMDPDDTQRILAGCKSRGIKLCGALAAAALIAAHSSRRRPEHHRKYGVVTLTDCRSLLTPPLTPHNFGFYHSAILNIHSINGNENPWDLAQRIYSSFENYKLDNKQFSDLADLSFLMCRAIENPSLTASSSLRTSLVSVFEEAVFDNLTEKDRELGLEDYVGCASVHGIGPSIAVYDTVRDGRLDCACVYPSPLHSREQMLDLIEKMKSVLFAAREDVDSKEGE